MGEHDGHRGRLKKRFLETGLSGFDDVTTLELYLTYAIPRQDTRKIAKNLIEKFGDLATVMEAPLELLEQVEGIGRSAATLLLLCHQIQKRHLIQRATFHKFLTSTGQCGEYLVPYFFGLRDEVVYLLCLDSKCMVLDCRMIFQGGINTASVSVRKIVELAVACNATSVVLSHNHTNGVALPSLEDKRTTATLRTALTAVGIELADHIIVAGEDFVSMADSGFFKDNYLMP
ncbi:MAG: JAB domain-containing protein [Eubacteriales bacterium]